MNTHNRFYGEVEKIILDLSPNTPLNKQCSDVQYRSFLLIFIPYGDIKLTEVICNSQDISIYFLLLSCIDGIIHAYLDTFFTNISNTKLTYSYIETKSTTFDPRTKWCLHFIWRQWTPRSKYMLIVVTYIKVYVYSEGPDQGICRKWRPRSEYMQTVTAKIVFFVDSEGPDQHICREWRPRSGYMQTVKA